MVDIENGMVSLEDFTYLQEKYIKKLEIQQSLEDKIFNLKDRIRSFHEGENYDISQLQLKIKEVAKEREEYVLKNIDSVARHNKVLDELSSYKARYPDLKTSENNEVNNPE